MLYFQWVAKWPAVAVVFTDRGLGTQTTVKQEEIHNKNDCALLVQVYTKVFLSLFTVSVLIWLITRAGLRIYGTLNVVQSVE